jgi:hypothetical protein
VTPKIIKIQNYYIPTNNLILEMNPRLRKFVLIAVIHVFWRFRIPLRNSSNKLSKGFHNARDLITFVDEQTCLTAILFSNS